MHMVHWWPADHANNVQLFHLFIGVMSERDKLLSGQAGFFPVRIRHTFAMRPSVDAMIFSQRQTSRHCDRSAISLVCTIYCFVSCAILCALDTIQRNSNVSRICLFYRSVSARLEHWISVHRGFGFQLSYQQQANDPIHSIEHFLQVC